MGERSCSVCGKKFFVSGDGWGYAYDGKITCSYHCMREMKREDWETMTDDEKKRIDALLEEGASKAEAAKTVGVHPQAVYDYTNKKERDRAKGVKKSPIMKKTEPAECHELKTAGPVVSSREVLAILADVIDILKTITRRDQE